MAAANNAERTFFTAETSFNFPGFHPSALIIVKPPNITRLKLCTPWQTFSQKVQLPTNTPFPDPPPSLFPKEQGRQGVEYLHPPLRKARNSNHNLPLRWSFFLRSESDRDRQITFCLKISYFSLSIVPFGLRCGMNNGLISCKKKERIRICAPVSLAADNVAAHFEACKPFD